MHGEDLSLVESGSGYVHVRFDACGPSSNVCTLLDTFDWTIWLDDHCRVQAAVTPFYKELVKFAQVGCRIDSCPIKGYRVWYESHIPEILLEGSWDWIPLKDLDALPYSGPSGLSYHRFIKFRNDRMAVGHRHSTIPDVSALLEDETSGEDGGAQPLQQQSLTPGIFFGFIIMVII